MGCSWLGCRAHILPFTASPPLALAGGSQGTERGGGDSNQSQIIESNMCGHQLFYISKKGLSANLFGFENQKSTKVYG